MKKTDRRGNTITFTPEDGRIFLKLASENRQRLIGELHDGEYHKIIKDKNIYRALKNPSVGFNADMIKALNPQRFKVTVLDGIYCGEFTFDRALYEQTKQYLHHSKQGFELQCFVALCCMTRT